MLTIILLLAALILFVLAALPRTVVGGFNLVPAGLACVVASMLVPLL